jgi:hypothetical protein
MGDYKLNTFVHAVEVDASGARTGRDKVFGPDDDLNKPENAWALAAITNPDVWDGAKPPRREPPAATGAGEEIAQLKARIAELEAAGGPSQSGIPPRGGSGSSAQAWREYATGVGVEVDPEASREDVIAALEKAGKPTE